MAFYEGIDEEIYEGGDHYVPMQRFRLNQNYTPTPVTPDIVPTSSTSYGIPTLYPYVRGEGGDGGYQGGGKWGNLDLSRSKTFTKDVWGEAFGPGKEGWTSKEITGYYNPDLGQYQTLEGKNINHLGIEVPTIAGALFDKGFGKGPQIGDIKGTFTDGWESGWENIKEGWEEEKDKWSGILNIDKAKAFFKDKKDKENIEFIDEKVDDTDPADVGTTTNTGHDPNIHGPEDYGKGSDGQQSYDTGQGFGAHATSGGPVSNRTGRGRTDWADGGRIGFFAHGGRVYLNLGGLARLL